jgi:ubiquinone/menaquinone biosynthesis C-methylase UbiE
MQIYADVMVPRMFEPWGRELLRELAVQAGEAVLNVACGPGSVTRLAAAQAGPTGRVTGCDLSPAMLAIAVGRGPVANGASIDYLEAPADRLPVPDGSFDVATCQQGLQFFPDRLAALAEIHRALRPGGRIGVRSGSASASAPRSPCWPRRSGRWRGASSRTAMRAGRGACRWPAICVRCWTVPGSRT